MTSIGNSQTTLNLPGGTSALTGITMSTSEDATATFVNSFLVNTVTGITLTAAD